MTPPRSPSWRSEGIIVLIVIVWGVNFVVVKAALAVMHPHVFNLLRLVVSALSLGLIYRHEQRRRREPFFKPLRMHTREIALLGMLGYGLYQIFFITGLDRSTAGNSAIIMSSIPLWAALIGQAFQLEYLTRLAWIGLFISLVGTLVVVMAGSSSLHFSPETRIGNLLILSAALCWGTYTAFNKPVLVYLSPVGLTFLGLLVSLPILLAFAFPYLGEVAWERVDYRGWAAIVYSGGLSTGVATAWWSASIKAIGPSKTAIFSNVVPLVAVFSGFLFLGETVRPLQLAGGALIIAGVLIMRTG
jgi:drug/metabolite transporter (DMT)-like permease